MARKQSTHKSVREKRLRRRKIILFLWSKWLGVWNWLKCAITFKKTLIVFCLLYVVDFVEYLKIQYESMGIPFPTDVATIVVTVFLGQLALTAISSLGSRAVEYVQAKFGHDENDINYG